MKRKAIFDDIRRMQNNIDSIFDSFFRDDYLNDLSLPSSTKLLPTNKNDSLDFRTPVTDIEEKDDKYIINIEIPGADKEDINLTYTENGIEVKVEKSKEKKSKNSYTRSSTSFYRFFTIPENTDIDKANAEYKNGVLRIDLPKIKIDSSKKKIIKIR
jgi:HSP20 family protein